MVKVYFEKDNGQDGNYHYVYAELVAIFDDEKTYAACLPALEILCKKHHFDLITESVDEGKALEDIVD